MPNSFYTLILAVGALQGLVLGSLLFWGKSTRPYAYRILACLLGFLSYRLTIEILRATGWIGVHHWSYHVLLEYNWSYGSLLYLFVRAYLNPLFRLSLRDWVHFIPLTIEFLFSNWVKTQNFFWDGNPDHLPWLGAESYILWEHTPFQLYVALLLLVGYGLHSLRLLSDASTQSIKGHPYKWLMHILRGYIVFAGVSILLVSIDYVGFDYAFRPRYPYPFYTILATLTYILGLAGYSHRHQPISRIASSVAPKLDAQTARLMTKRLEKLMQQGIFRQADLTLDQLAKAMAIKPYLLTILLNEYLKIKFTDYLHQYRVQEVIRLMDSPLHTHYTLMGIALEAGFNSKASFNRIFKKQTGQSPRDFRAKTIRSSSTELSQ